jgi:hypothetical protein
MTTPQTQATITTPTTRVPVPPATTGAALNVGDIVLYSFAISTVVGGVVGAPALHTFTPSPTQPLGSQLVIPFASMTPVFSPVAGTEYSAYCYDTDSVGDASGNTNVVTWTQAEAAPNAPSTFTVG